MTINVPIVNAFIDDTYGGNPAGVVLNAEQYSSQQKQAIAAGVGLSETAFVSGSECADFKLEFFTPSRQIAHCGHATIAAFSYLQQEGLLKTQHSSKETIDGCRDIHFIERRAYMGQSAPSYQTLSPAQHSLLLKSLGLTETDLLSVEPQVVNTGNSFIIAGVQSAEILKSLKVEHAQLTELSEMLDLIGVYVFTTETTHPGRQASTRMFAPRYGISEEAATGMAAGPLACYLYDIAGQKQTAVSIEQGYFMAAPSPSVIHVELSLTPQGDIAHLLAGGRAVAGEVRVIDL